MIRKAIEKVVTGLDLTEEEMVGVMGLITEGEATDSQIAAFLVGLRMKGETAAEITGAARVLRTMCTPVVVSEDLGPLLDTCGTGGDGKSTFNVSTVSALVAAASGARVAKHGNRSVSSSCGSADLLERLGVNIELSPEEIAVCIEEAGIGFLYAPGLHGSMRFVAPARRETGIRTIFNILGPLANPAKTACQLTGVFDGDLVSLIADVFRRLGASRAVVVHGEGGYDELTVTGESRMVVLRDGLISERTVRPQDYGLDLVSEEDVPGGTVVENVRICLDVLEGGPGPARDMVLLNSGAALVAGGLAADLGEGVGMAGEAIDSGMARGKLDQLIELSGSLHARSVERAGTCFGG
ncbi:anthranilate phosphoribosyltransferase [Candidatus Fermentibacteria bacterium]|nr:anthranilate phosphoribosyltransferase [Candidatus Fermentibacteria bacterium]